MRRVTAGLAVLALAATGCSFSTVKANATVHVSGRALDATGRPLAHARVLLFKQADIGEVVFGGALVLGSFSTVCFLPHPPAICEKAHTTTTDANGRYAFTITGADTQGSLGTEATLDVVFAGANGRTSTTVSFGAKADTVALPDARLWNLGAHVAQSSGTIDVSWSPLPGAAGGHVTYSAQLYGGQGTASWSQPASGGRASLDPRLLEDQAGTVAVGAGTELAGGSGTGTVRASYLSPRLAVHATAGAPPSRGRACAAVTGTAPVGHGAFTGCPATDGVFDRPARLSAGGKVVTGVVVDLGRARPVGLVVARGFSGQFLVEISTDGTSYRTVATEAGSANAFSIPGAPVARFVRLRSPSGLDESLASEVSVWS